MGRGREHHAKVSLFPEEATGDTWSPVDEAAAAGGVGRGPRGCIHMALALTKGGKKIYCSKAGKGRRCLAGRICLEVIYLWLFSIFLSLQLSYTEALLFLSSKYMLSSHLNEQNNLAELIEYLAMQSDGRLIPI